MILKCYETINALDNDFEYQQMKVLLMAESVLQPVVEVITDLYETIKEIFQPVVFGLVEAVKSYHKIIKNYSKVGKVIALTKHKKNRVRKKNLARLERLLVA